ncbi:MAG: 5-formyltetrahydrofolate cyclo-ligase [Burkholderiales bacterium]|nr:5-formyltetrahydrofolate cyclo-ligase [Burkholderiales bacterium]
MRKPLTKPELRQSLIALRQGIAPTLHAQWDIAIGNRLTAWLAAHNAKTVGVYWPIRAEPDLREFYAEWAARGTQLTLPVVIDKNTPLKFLAWTPGEPLMRDAMGVMVPASTATEVQPDVVLVPCVGFTTERFRLGYGAGFYDRTLASAPKPQAVGVAYSCLCAEFDTALHDVALDAIVTENALV